MRFGMLHKTSQISWLQKSNAPENTQIFPEKLMVGRFFSHFPLKTSSLFMGKLACQFSVGGISTGFPRVVPPALSGPGASAASSLRAPRWLASRRCRTTSGRATGSHIRMMPRGQGAQLKTDQIENKWPFFPIKLPVKWSNKAIRGGLSTNRSMHEIFQRNWSGTNWGWKIWVDKSRVINRLATFFLFAVVSCL